MLLRDQLSGTADVRDNVSCGEPLLLEAWACRRSESISRCSSAFLLVQDLLVRFVMKKDLRTSFSYFA